MSPTTVPDTDTGAQDSRALFDPYTGMLSRVDRDGEEHAVAGPLTAEERLDLMRDLAPGTGHRVAVGEIPDNTPSGARVAFTGGRNFYRATPAQIRQVWQAVAEAEDTLGQPSPDGVMAVLVGVWGVPEQTVARLRWQDIRQEAGGAGIVCPRAPLGWWPVDTACRERLEALRPDGAEPGARVFDHVGEAEEVAARVGAVVLAGCGVRASSGELFAHTHRMLARMPSSPLWDPVRLLAGQY